jgi:hypothetical protein
MAEGDYYRIRAAELTEAARHERNPEIRKEFEHLALAYLRLADQADRNNANDLVYETPRPARKA